MYINNHHCSHSILVGEEEVTYHTQIGHILLTSIVYNIEEKVIE